MGVDRFVLNPAVVLAVAERVSPSLNGASSFLLASALEALNAGMELGDHSEFEAVAAVLQTLDEGRVAHWESTLADLDAEVVTVADARYPANLRMIHDHPPFLFVRGSLAADDRAIAIVGTRKPSDQGMHAARELARQFAERGITVVSGLAAGIDTAAHQAALAAGGRTLAVLGTGIQRTYPSENRALALEISRSGALLSQFWPDMAPTRWSFPVRNIVTSGLSLGTVVVEAGPTSGARQQAQHALRHGKRLFLHRELVQSQPWAEAMMEMPGAIAISDLDEVVAAVEMDLDLHRDLLV